MPLSPLPIFSGIILDHRDTQDLQVQQDSKLPDFKAGQFFGGNQPPRRAFEIE
jgi:hypothetical protein